MATGGENYKIQCLLKILSNELTTKPIKVDVILKQSFFFCTVVSGLSLLKLNLLYMYFFILLLLSMCGTHFSFKWVWNKYGIKKYLIITIIIIVIVMITKWL